MKQLVRRYVYWEEISHDIETHVKSCEESEKIRNNPPKVTVHPWDEPKSNWERLHIDYAGPFEGHHFLVAIDAKSKWAEVRVLQNSPTTESTINLLSEIFCFHGFPNSIVSDNASIFTSDAFKSFCKNHGITQRLIAPGHPATNGLAERNVQTLKRRLKSMANETGTISDKVRRMLLRYRAMPLACGKSPAELYLYRRLRIELDSIFPVPKEERRNPLPKPERSLRVGERVQVRLYVNNTEKWEFGTVKTRLGSCHYIVDLDSGRSIKRHINQLISTHVPHKTLNEKKEKSMRGRPSVKFNIPGIPDFRQRPPRQSQEFQPQSQEQNIPDPDFYNQDSEESSRSM